MDKRKASAWLADVWNVARHDGAPDPEIDSLINSPVVSIRYALITQLLGKIADPSRDILAIQVAGETHGWDARSFAKDVVVPWVTKNHNIVGTSGDPYVGQPLRRNRLDTPTSLKRRKDWDKLVKFLAPLEHAECDDLKRALSRCLDSVARMGRSQEVSINFPERVSLERLCEMITCFTETPSGGLRPMAVCVSIMDVVGRATGLFDRIESQGINEADKATGAVADITCYKRDDIMLAIKVKDRTVTMRDFQDTVAKANGGVVSNILFAVPAVVDGDVTTVNALKQKTWRGGRNLYHANIPSLLGHIFVLLDECWRIALLRRVAEELQRRGRYEDRAEWGEQCMSS